MAGIIRTLLFALAIMACSGFANAEISQKYSISDDAALKNLEQMASDGDVAAQYKLGIIYLTGNGVEASKAKALKWIRAAAWRGDPKAQVLVAASYAFPSLFGLNVQEQDKRACAFVLQKAAKKGDKFAKKMLAYSYLLGYDGQKRTDKAKEEDAKKAEPLFKELGMTPEEYKFPADASFSQIFEEGLEQAYNLNFKDGKVTSFDDDKYPG